MPFANQAFVLCAVEDELLYGRVNEDMLDMGVEIDLGNGTFVTIQRDLVTLLPDEEIATARASLDVLLTTSQSVDILSRHIFSNYIAPATPENLCTSYNEVIHSLVSALPDDSGCAPLREALNKLAEAVLNRPSTTRDSNSENSGISQTIKSQIFNFSANIPHWSCFVKPMHVAPVATASLAARMFSSAVNFFEQDVETRESVDACGPIAVAVALLSTALSLKTAQGVSDALKLALAALSPRAAAAGSKLAKYMPRTLKAAFLRLSELAAKLASSVSGYLKPILVNLGSLIKRLANSALDFLGLGVTVAAWSSGGITLNVAAACTICGGATLAVMAGWWYWKRQKRQKIIKEERDRFEQVHRDKRRCERRILMPTEPGATGAPTARNTWPLVACYVVTALYALEMSKSVVRSALTAGFAYLSWWEIVFGLIMASVVAGCVTLVVVEGQLLVCQKLTKARYDWFLRKHQGRCYGPNVL